MGNAVSRNKGPPIFGSALPIRGQKVNFFEKREESLRSLRLGVRKSVTQSRQVCKENSNKTVDRNF
jgi:hypothetical protein